MVFKILRAKMSLMLQPWWLIFGTLVAQGEALVAQGEALLAHDAALVPQV